jgi:hypothetical protein
MAASGSGMEATSLAHHGSQKGGESSAIMVKPWPGSGQILSQVSKSSRKEEKKGF